MDQVAKLEARLIAAERELQASRQRYESLVRNETQFIWGTGPEGLVDDMPEWRTFTGQTQAEVLGAGWADALHPDDRDRATRAWRAAVAAREGYDIEYRVKHHDGDYRWLHVRGVPVLETDGTIREWIGVADDVTARHEAAAATTLHFERLKAHSDRVETERDQFWTMSLDLLDIVGLDGYLKAVNPAWHRLLGWTDDELKARPFLDLVHPDDLAPTLAEMDKLAEGVKTLHFENRLRMKSGDWRLIEWTARPHADVIYAYGRDMTERQETIAAVARQNQELRAQTAATERERQFVADLVQTLPGGVAYLDRDLVYQLVNPTYARLFEVAVGTSLPATLQADAARFTQVLTTGEPWKQEALPLPGGGYGDVELHAMKGPAGAITGVLAVVNDATERVRLVHEMRHQQALTDQIVEEAPAGIAYLDAKLVVRRINATYVRLLGIPAEQIVERTLSEAFGEPVEGPIQATLRQVLRTGEIYRATSQPFARLRADGPETSYWDYTCAPVTRDGETQGVLVLATEVSDRFEKEQLQIERIEALEAMDRYKDEFLSVISHELRTPLNFIMGFASTLDDEVQGPLNEGQHQAMGKIMAGADRMLALVDDLLDFAKLQSGRFELSSEPTPYLPLVDEVLSLMQGLAETKGITLDLAGDVPGAPVLDPRRVSQVLVNLVNNAIKFTDAGGRVTVTAQEVGDRLVTRVTDTGRGIAPADRSKLFARFQQVDMSATRSAGGTGLGLAISKALVEAHGGTIDVESTVGVGSTFWFSLPLR